LYEINLDNYCAYMALSNCGFFWLQIVANIGRNLAFTCISVTIHCGFHVLTTLQAGQLKTTILTITQQ